MDALSFAQTWRTPALVLLTRAADPLPTTLARPPLLTDAVFTGDANRKDVVPLVPGELEPGSVFD